MKQTVPTIEEFARNLRARREAATPQNVTEGRAWYPAMGRLILTILAEAEAETGDFGGTSPAQAVGIFAAYSQNATWKANVTMASRYLSGGGLRGMKRVCAEIVAIEDGADPTDAAILGLKRADFCANLLGDLGRVTCDRWHLRAAFDSETPMGLSGKRGELVHFRVTEATKIVAAEYGETPAECQAVIWCQIRGMGE